jgi:DUF4097 and DUF4098 domain-containing protein YvlB
MSTVPPPQPPSSQPPGQPPPYPPPQPGMDPRDYARAQKDYYRAWRDQQKSYWRANREQWRTQRDHWRERAWYGRRRSLVGPIILIAIGIVFLLVQTGHMESWRAWEWFGHWWPVILIAAGIGRLIEWMIDRDSPYPPRSSGFVGLLVVIIVVGCIATGFNHAHMQGWGNTFNFGDDSDFSMFHGPEHDYDGQFWAAVPAGNSLQIVSSVRGDIAVTTAEAGSTPPPPPGEVMNLAGAVVYIRLHKKVHTNDEQKAKREADDFVPVATHDGPVTTIHIDPKSDDVGASLEVVVPADVVLSVLSQHGDLSVAGVKANVATDTHHGDLRFSDLGGNLAINADHGDVTVSGVHGDVAMNGHFGDINVSDVTGALSMNGDFPGDLNLRNIDGQLRFHSNRTDLEVARIADQLTIDSGDLHGASLAGPFNLKTRDFNVDLTNVSGDVSITNSNGDVNLTAARPLGSIDIDNHSSSIRVTLPYDAGFQLDAETSGEISNDFGIGNTENGERKTARGTVGNGAIKVTLKSNEDDISIRRENDAVTVPPVGPRLSTAAPAESGLPRLPNLPHVPNLPHLPHVPRLSEKPAPPTAPPAPPAPETVNQ